MTSTTLAIFIIVSIISAIAAWAFASLRQQKKDVGLNIEVEQLKKQLKQLSDEKIAKDKQISDLQALKSQLEQESSANKARLETTITREQDYKNDIQDLKNQSSELKKTLQEFQARLSEEMAAKAKLTSTVEAAKERLTKYDEQLQIKSIDLKNEQAARQEDLKKLALTQKEKAEFETQLKAERDNFTQLMTEKDSQLEKHILELKSTKEELSQERNSHNKTKEILSSERQQHGQLKTELDQKQQAFERQLEQINESRENLKKEFEVLANEVLEVKARAFKEQNAENIGHLLNPLKNEIQVFKERIETIHKDDISARSSLKTELLNLQKLNQDITQQAEKLTNALRTEKKKQGNWGELILENVLDSSGLRLNEDYTLQKAYKDDEGNTQLPDAVVKLPQGKNLIIDAKTSLNAYTEYVNCEDEQQAQYYLASHVKAVGDRINELSNKNYFKIPDINSPEVVIMFIPVESAYVEALRFDDSLYQRAIENNVLVATPTTLLTSLNIVRQLWRFEDQNKHTAELAKRADLFYQKLNGFLVSMQGVGKQLDKAKDSYEKAFGQLYSGRGNLIKQASEFKNLGVAVQKELPVELVSKANLELDVMIDNRDKG